MKENQAILFQFSYIILNFHRKMLERTQNVFMHENFGIFQEFLIEDFGIFQCITIEDFGILFRISFEV